MKRIEIWEINKTTNEGTLIRDILVKDKLGITKVINELIYNLYVDLKYESWNYNYVIKEREVDQ